MSDTDSSLAQPEWDDLGIPESDDAEPADAGVDHDADNEDLLNDLDREEGEGI